MKKIYWVLIISAIIIITLIFSFSFMTKKESTSGNNNENKAETTNIELTGFYLEIQKAVADPVEDIDIGDPL